MLTEEGVEKTMEISMDKSLVQLQQNTMNIHNTIDIHWKPRIKEQKIPTYERGQEQNRYDPVQSCVPTWEFIGRIKGWWWNKAKDCGHFAYDTVIPLS